MKWLLVIVVFVMGFVQYTRADYLLVRDIYNPFTDTIVKANGFKGDPTQYLTYMRGFRDETQYSPYYTTTSRYTTGFDWVGNTDEGDTYGEGFHRYWMRVDRYVLIIRSNDRAQTQQMEIIFELCFDSCEFLSIDIPFTPGMFIVTNSIIRPITADSYPWADITPITWQNWHHSTESFQAVKSHVLKMLAEIVPDSLIIPCIAFGHISERKEYVDKLRAEKLDSWIYRYQVKHHKAFHGQAFIPDNEIIAYEKIRDEYATLKKKLLGYTAYYKYVIQERIYYSNYNDIPPNKQNFMRSDYGIPLDMDKKVILSDEIRYY